MSLPLRLREALTLGGLSVRELLVRTWNKITEHEILTRAAAVAFYAMLALVPFLGLVLTLVVRLLPDLTGRSGSTVGVANLTVEQLDSTLRTMFPKEAYGVIKDQIVRIQNDSHLGLISFGLAVTIWLASSLFLAVIDAMNRIYGVTETRPFWKLRLTAIVMTLIQAIILVGSLLAIVAWPQILNGLGLSAPAQVVATLIQWVVVFLMVSVSFALTFYIGPDAQQRWEWITPGSVFGTLVFLIQTFGFRVYVQNFANYNQAYGSLGGVMVLLFWFWLSSVVILTAAEQNKIIEDASPLGKTYGQKIDPPSSPDFGAAKPELSSREGVA
ncbi:YihY/virulence factor BrkB family protein [Singulisphaera acidiphila]|uniref:Putative membrane protein n=1 Tax=Singulisphaera acidiphila (strain ATCC BAA-1392 / DSM 18658 / VKM B-2454 / MOB10) TaxID=886293 RepID=L0D9C0_SINAD|nr:YihY/virulence factor BrkB family protein [Singulisphaera acidiphila]AGA25408.1 putative membrane protein [Singulisphaera acidiphila DSM 18658]